MWGGLGRGKMNLDKLDKIIHEVIGSLLARKTFEPDHPEFLSVRSDDIDVRTVIHSMLRMIACNGRRRDDRVNNLRRISVRSTDRQGHRTRPLNPTHTISPCYKSRNTIECKHSEDCPYVIGHSIYLWVGLKLNALHPSEDKGVGCNYKHEIVNFTLPDYMSLAQRLNARAFRTREAVFSRLEELYGQEHVALMAPLEAMFTIDKFYTTMVPRLRNHGQFDVAAFPGRDLNDGSIGIVEIPKSDDRIFWVPGNDSEDYSDDQSQGDQSPDGESTFRPLPTPQPAARRNLPPLHPRHSSERVMSSEATDSKGNPRFVPIAIQASLYVGDDDM